MTDDSPYTKREVDEWRNDVKEHLNVITDSLDDMKVSDTAYAKTVNELAKITSNNAGQIIAIWNALEADRKAVKLIEDIMATWKVTKWVIGFVVAMCGLVVALKSAIGSWIIHLISK